MWLRLMLSEVKSRYDLKPLCEELSDFHDITAVYMTLYARAMLQE